MSARFHSFIIFAEMRTGSNFLETNLNALEGVTCVGEAFNPYFIGAPDKVSIFDVTQEARDADPTQLLDKIYDRDDLCGFRYFHDHDPRILDEVIEDPECAKIILSRDPAESYVSWKIAQQTGQWRLTSVKRRKNVKAVFDAQEFTGMVAAHMSFRKDLERRLQISGQTAFHVSYEDLQSLDVLNGLAAFLGVEARLSQPDRSLTIQNPEPLSTKVENPAEMQAALDALTAYDLDQAQDFEPRRFAAVSSYIIAAKAPLAYFPIKGGPVSEVRAWMAALDGVPETSLNIEMSNNDMRRWLRKHKGRRCFTVISHPLERAHRVFCHHILGRGPQVYLDIRRKLIAHFGLQLPDFDAREAYTVADHRAAFAAFLAFLQANLNGQTGIRVDPAWCSQQNAIQGFGTLSPPDVILREKELAQSLPRLAALVGDTAPHYQSADVSDDPFSLAQIYDDEIEALAIAAYRRDYIIFGFGRWDASQAA